MQVIEIKKCKKGHEVTGGNVYRRGNLMKCRRCILDGTSRYYYSHKAKRREQNAAWYAANKERKSETTTHTRRYMRYDCIVYLGGVCVDCGYKEHLNGFEFDHVPEKGVKASSVSRLIRGQTGDWNKIKPELDKCDLVCGTCHNIRTAARQERG